VGRACVGAGGACTPRGTAHAWPRPAALASPETAHTGDLSRFESITCQHVCRQTCWHGELLVPQSLKCKRLVTLLGMQEVVLEGGRAGPRRGAGLDARGVNGVEGEVPAAGEREAAEAARGAHDGRARRRLEKGHVVHGVPLNLNGSNAGSMDPTPGAVPGQRSSREGGAGAGRRPRRRRGARWSGAYSPPAGRPLR